MGILAIIEVVITMLSGALVSLGVKPEYAGVISSIEKAITALQLARTEAITRDELESLRTTPQW